MANITSVKAIQILDKLKEKEEIKNKKKIDWKEPK